MKQNLKINITDLDAIIERLEKIKKLYEDIHRLQDIPIQYPAPQPEPMPYIPRPSRTTDPEEPWLPKHKIWC